MPAISYSETVRQIAANAPSDYQLRIRGPIQPGFSGADVLLVDVWLEDALRLAVLKVTDTNKADEERAGHDRAQGSWLKSFLPERIISLATPADDGRVGLIMPLAGERLEHSSTLRDVLHDAVPYAIDSIIFSLAHAYRNAAFVKWKTAPLVSLREIFEAPLAVGFRKDWEADWATAAFPSVETPGVVVGHGSERLPNPLSFWRNPDMWPDSDWRGAIPSFMMHGDLNSGNVLCPNVFRAVTLGIAGREASPASVAEYIRLIDCPFARDLPFPYDLAYLLVWSRMDLLPSPTTQFEQNVFVRAVRAGLETITRGSTTAAIQPEAHIFVQLVQKIWTQVSSAQPSMIEDIRAAFLMSISGASLWQAIKAVRNDRPNAATAFWLSALALQEAIGTRETGVPAPDAHFSVDGLPLTAPPGLAVNDAAVDTTTEWTEGTFELAALLRRSGRSRIVLVLGSKVAAQLDVAEMNRNQSSIGGFEDPFAGLDSLTHENATEVAALGKLPLAAVFDWGTNPALRIALGAGIPATRSMAVLFDGETDVDRGTKDDILFVPLCGTVERLSTLALNPRERIQRWGRLRPAMDRFRSRRPPDLVVVYVSPTQSELESIATYLGTVWTGDYDSVVLGQDTEESRTLCENWGMTLIQGGWKDIVAVALDAATESLPVVPGGVKRLRVSGRRNTSVEDLHVDLVSTSMVEVPDEDADAIMRAGQLLYADDVLEFELADRAEEFFRGHRITWPQIYQSVPVPRQAADVFLEKAVSNLDQRHPQIHAMLARPGAGASTSLRVLAYRLAYEYDVPTVILDRAGNAAFEAIERLYRIIGRSFVVIADPNIVPADELAALRTRCAPSRYPVTFLTSARVLSKAPIVRGVERVAAGASQTPILDLLLSESEFEEFLIRIARFCPSADANTLARSSTRSLFLLSLEAFGGDNVRLDPFVQTLMQDATDAQRDLLGLVSFFSRFAYRASSIEILQIITGKTVAEIDTALLPFHDLLVTEDIVGWHIRHEEVSLRVLQFVLTGKLGGDEYRAILGEYAVGIINQMAETEAGMSIAAEHIWAIINPQLNAFLHEAPRSRFFEGIDGLPADTFRDQVLQTASETFSSHVNILSHYGKFLSERLQRWADADHYLSAALEIDPENPALHHIVGTRYFDELRAVVRSNPAKDRSGDKREKVADVGQAALDAFARARDLDVGSEYNYTTPLQVDAFLVEDELRRLQMSANIYPPARYAEAVTTGRISGLFAHADGLIAEGLRYIEPRRETRQAFSEVRARLMALKGDVGSAIASLRTLTSGSRGSNKNTSRVQLARLLVDRAESRWQRGDTRDAFKDFAEAAEQVETVLEDPASRFKSIRLWFDCVRHLPGWSRDDFVDRLQQLHTIDPDNLDTAFLLAALYFCDSVETSSPASWREAQKFQAISARLSSNLAVRRYTREWLVSVQRQESRELRVFPNNLFERAEVRTDASAISSAGDPRVELTGLVSRVETATVAELRIDGCGLPLYFQPRVKGREFYQTDENRTRVKFLVAFTYEKPQAFDVRRI